jgi:hypothetical protein
VRRLPSGLLLLAIASGPAPLGAQPTPPPEAEAPEEAGGEKAPKPDPEGREQDEEARAREPLPVYIPPARGTIRVRVGAATRGAREDHPALDALAPDHVAFTTEAQPVLCWYLSAATDTRIDISLIDDRSSQPLLELTVPPGIEPGVQVLRLADHDVSQETGRVYQWFVALVPDPRRRSADVIASGAVERVQPGPELSRALASMAAGDDWRVYAGHGVWYDALARLSARIREDPRNRGLRSARLQLFEQVDLPQAAAHDRRALGS